MMLTPASERDSMWSDAGGQREEALQGIGDIGSMSPGGMPE